MNIERINKLADIAQSAIRELAEEIRDYDDMTAANIDALADEVERTIEEELSDVDGSGDDD